MKKIYEKATPAVSLGINGAKRLTQTAFVLGRTGFDWILGPRLSTPELVRQAFERMGATYIKLGQLIASSPSLFPEPYVKEFQKCLDQTEPLPFPAMQRILAKSLGPDYIPNVFAHIDPEPLASASIAQVYAARLATGEDVVIKVQRPGVQDILVTDLNFLYYAACILERLVPRLRHASLAGILSEIRKTVLEECDFIKEAENIEIFKDFLNNGGHRMVVVPRVYHQASSQQVLTMERLYGIQMTDRETFLRSTDHPQKILSSAFNTWLQSISDCAIFHADLHAGNLLILNDDRVGFIDFGIVGRISDKTKKAVNSLILAMMVEDFKSMAEAMLTIGMTRKTVNTEQLADDLEALYAADIQSGGADPFIFAGNPAEPDPFLLEIVRIAEVHGIRFPREFTLLLKQVLYFDAYADLLFDVDDFLMEDFLEDMMNRPNPGNFQGLQ